MKINNFFKKNFNKEVIDDISKITDGENLYILVNQETYEKSYNEDDIIQFDREIDIPEFKDFKLVKINSYKAKVYNNTGVVHIIYSKDLVNISEDILTKNLKNITFECLQNISSPQQKKIQEKIKKSYFINCKLKELTNKDMIQENNNGFNVFFIDCYIEKIEHDCYVFLIHPSKFRNCIFENVNQKIDTIDTKGKNTKDNNKKFIIKDNTIYNLITENKLVIIRNSTIYLYHNKNLENTNFNFDNVKIKFKRNVLKKIESQYYSGYWNTYDHLLTMRSLSSEKLSLEKYINFFSSRDQNLNLYQKIIKRFLFCFHGGYTHIYITSSLSILLVFANYYLLTDHLNFYSDPLIKILYPIELLRDVIFKNFSFSNEFSIIKTIILLLELLLIYTFISFAITIKKIFGFKHKT